MKTVFLKLTSVVRVLLTVSDRLGVALWQHEASLCFQDSGKHTRLSLWMEINVNVSLLWLLYYTAVKEGGGVKVDGWTVDQDCRLQGSAGCWKLLFYVGAWGKCESPAWNHVAVNRQEVLVLARTCRVLDLIQQHNLFSVCSVPSTPTEGTYWSSDSLSSVF